MKYDIFIAGSGLGGLLCGYMLSKEGYKVCIAEKNEQAGGSLQTFMRDNCIFDTGGHYIGGLSEGQNLYKYFKYFDLYDKLKLRKLDEEHFDIVSFGEEEKDYKFAMGEERFIERLHESFPKELKGLKRYVSKLKEVVNEYALYSVKAGVKNFHQKTENAENFIKSITEDRRLREVLAGTNMLYAGTEKTPLYIHSLIISSFIESAYRLIDGNDQIALILSENIRANGGEILLNTKVKKFINGKEGINYAEINEGELIEAKYFISNLHPALTYEMIDTDKVRSTYREHIKSMENTTSMFVIYATLKENEFPYYNYNHYHHENNKVWESTKFNKNGWNPESYLLITPAISKSTVYADKLIIMSYMSINDVRKWENTYIEERGEEYLEFKQRNAEKLLNLVEKRYPKIRQSIHKFYTSTPLTYRDYIGTKDGSLYGILKSSYEPMLTSLSTKTKIPNLFMTGQNINMHGVLGVTIGAVLTCAEFIGLEYLIKKINNEL